MSVSLVPAAARAHTDLGWLDSWHSFNFGGHYSPDDEGHGLLLVSNDDTVSPGGGFGTHAHRDMEIVTWVMSGSLEHRDSEGNVGRLVPGVAQRMSAGTGIRHSEMNASSDEPVHFIQMWVPPDAAGVAPGYEHIDVSEALDAGGLVAIASGQGHAGAVRIQQESAVLWGARLGDGESIEVPDGPFVHVFLAAGGVTLTGVGSMVAGDAARLVAAGELELAAQAASEVLIWVTG